MKECCWFFHPPSHLSPGSLSNSSVSFRCFTYAERDKDIMAEVSAENLTERIIRNLEEGSAFFDTEELRRNYSSLVAKIKAGAKLAITGIELLCKVCGYLFDPEEGYVALKNQIVALLSWMAETLDLREDIPRDVRPKLDEMNGYLTKIQELIDKIGQDIAELIQVLSIN